MIAREGRQRARARLPARAARGRSSPATARTDDDRRARARAAGADLVLELPRGGKVARPGRRRRRARRGELLAFSDANARWEPGALRALVARVRRPAGRLRLRAGELRRRRRRRQPGGPLLALRDGAARRWSRALASVTAGNGAIYAVRRDAYLARRPGHGPRPLVPVHARQARPARGLRAGGAARPRRWSPTIEGEFAPQAADDGHAWPIVAARRDARPRGYPPLLRLMIVSHRLLRYAAPFLHLVALAANLALLGERRALRRHARAAARAARRRAARRRRPARGRC